MLLLFGFLNNGYSLQTKYNKTSEQRGETLKFNKENAGWLMMFLCYIPTEELSMGCLVLPPVINVYIYTICHN